MALVATVGAANADSYITLAEADAYLAARFGTAAWDALSDDDKEKALRQATREVDRHRFRGSKAFVDGSLQFPRYEQSEALTVNPRSVREACAEQALWIAANAANGGRSDRQKLQADGVQAWAVGDASETLGPGGGGSLSPLCPDARALLVRWISRTGRLISDREQASNGRRIWPLSP